MNPATTFQKFKKLCKTDNVDAVIELSTEHQDFTKYMSTCLKHSCLKNKPLVSKWLFQNVDASSQTRIINKFPIYCSRNNLEIVKWLHTENSITVLMLLDGFVNACEYGSISVIEYIYSIIPDKINKLLKTQPCITSLDTITTHTGKITKRTIPCEGNILTFNINNGGKCFYENVIVDRKYIATTYEGIATNLKEKLIKKISRNLKTIQWIFLTIPNICLNEMFGISCYYKKNSIIEWIMSAQNVNTKLGFVMSCFVGNLKMAFKFQDYRYNADNGFLDVCMRKQHTILKMLINSYKKFPKSKYDCTVSDICVSTFYLLINTRQHIIDDKFNKIYDLLLNEEENKQLFFNITNLLSYQPISTVKWLVAKAASFGIYYDYAYAFDKYNSYFDLEPLKYFYEQIKISGQSVNLKTHIKNTICKSELPALKWLFSLPELQHTNIAKMINEKPKKFETHIIHNVHARTIQDFIDFIQWITSFEPIDLNFNCYLCTDDDYYT